MDDKLLSCIILAAGKSSRMGCNKLLLNYKGKEIIRHTIEKTLSVNNCEIIVVLGHEAEKLKEILHEYPIKLAYNMNYNQGQSTSLKKGLEQVSKKSLGFLFMLGDQPIIKIQTIEILVKTFLANPDKIIVPYYNNKRGNPVIFPKSYHADILKLQGDIGARSLITEDKVIKITVDDPGVILDIDTPEEYKRLRGFS